MQSFIVQRLEKYLIPSSCLQIHMNECEGKRLLTFVIFFMICELGMTVSSVMTLNTITQTFFLQLSKIAVIIMRNQLVKFIRKLRVKESEKKVK